MDKIIFPLESGMQSSEVANLQDALLIFLENGIILPNNEAARRAMSERLKQGERVNQFYDGDTLKIVDEFQKERNLQRSVKWTNQQLLTLISFWVNWGCWNKKANFRFK